jgi:hypothetical protein
MVVVGVVRRGRGRSERGARGEEGTGEGENGSPPRGDTTESHGGGGWRWRLTSAPPIGFRTSGEDGSADEWRREPGAMCRGLFAKVV